MKVRMFDAKKSDVFDFRFPSLPPSFKKIQKKSCISYTKALVMLPSFDFVFLCRSAIFKQAWLRLALSRLGIIQTSLASALAAPELDIALGLASVWLLRSLNETLP